MGDRRFDRAWDEWESVADAARTDFLRDHGISHLVAMLASKQAGVDPYSRNVIASAIMNRVELLQRGAPPDPTEDVVSRIREMVERSLVLARDSRSIAAASRLLSLRARMTARQSVLTRAPRSAAEHDP